MIYSLTMQSRSLDCIRHEGAIHINQGGDSMKKKILIPVIAGALIIIGVVLFFILRSGDDSYFSIRILHTEGNVNIKRDGNSINAAKDMKLRDKDNIIVGSDGFTRIDCDRKTYAHFEHDTEASIKATSDKKLTINMVKGELVIDLQQKLADDERLNVVTPNTTLAIRGTVVAVRTYPTEDGGTKTINYCLEGKAVVETDQGSETIEAGEGWLTVTNAEGNITEYNPIDAAELEFEGIDIDSLQGADNGPMVINNTVSFVSNTDTSGVEINGTNFPDMMFRLYIMDKLDLDKNLILSGDELTLDYLDISYNGIKDLKGIEFFKDLTTLNCNNNELTSLDLSGNPKLRGLNCGENSILDLNISKNEQLDYLDCHLNPLNGLDVSKNINLTALYCYKDQLNKLNVSANTLLNYLYCGDNPITELDVSNNTALIEFSCSNTMISQIDISNNTQLTFFNCSTNNITELDVSRNTELKDLTCPFTGISKLDLSHNTKLTSLNIMYTELTETDLTNNPLLAEESIYYDEGKNKLIR